MFNRTVIILAFLVFLCGLTGCMTNSEKDKEILNKKEVASIQLECTELCKQKGTAPFSVKTFEYEKDIELFAKAINEGSEKMLGTVDYGAYFLMQINLKDGTQKKYVLNIDKEFGTKGLLVESSNSSQGYTISQEFSFELSKIIYK